MTDVAGIVNITHVAEIVKLTHVARILEAGSMYDHCVLLGHLDDHYHQRRQKGFELPTKQLGAS